jgi:hypothetical protein
MATPAGARVIEVRLTVSEVLLGEYRFHAIPADCAPRA